MPVRKEIPSICAAIKKKLADPDSINIPIRYKIFEESEKEFFIYSKQRLLAKKTLIFVIATRDNIRQSDFYDLSLEKPMVDYFNMYPINYQRLRQGGPYRYSINFHDRTPDRLKHNFMHRLKSKKEILNYAKEAANNWLTYSVKYPIFLETISSEASLSIRDEVRLHELTQGLLSPLEVLEELFYELLPLKTRDSVIALGHGKVADMLRTEEKFWLRLLETLRQKEDWRLVINHNKMFPFFMALS